MGTVTREQVARKAGRSVRTVRSWETKGMLPRALPDVSEDKARYREMQLVPGRTWADVAHVIIQGSSIFFVMKDTCEHGDNIVVRMPTRAAQVAEKRLDSKEQYDDTVSHVEASESALKPSGAKEDKEQWAQK